MKLWLSVSFFHRKYTQMHKTVALKQCCIRSDKQKSRILKDAAFFNRFAFLLYQRSGILNTYTHYAVRLLPSAYVQKTIWS